MHPGRQRQRGLGPTPRPASCRWTTFEKGARPMAIYHLAVKSVSRSTGRSAVAAIAYRAGVELVNERDGLVHDYTRRGEIGSASGRERVCQYVEIPGVAVYLKIKK